MTGILWHKHHIIPKHIGGTDSPSNLIKVNLAMHSYLHKCLFEEQGRWQDKLAWQMLSKKIGKDELVREIGRQNGLRWKGIPKTKEHNEKVSIAKMGHSVSQEVRNVISFHRSKDWIVISPEGEEKTINNLKKFCKENNLTHTLMQHVANGQQTHHKQWKCKKV
jgi:hypothetical protein